ncbi:hypothetical protein KFL_000910130 [Klebsormidium nitens]|uniref:Uncharacterized protein n=1 Tax=Klebsormidium nitens TaxID=105231 RepID=A0A1Y1HUI8_KLENI|nr:hypothetical protein KFL_000910130 [Klebsormidium nitens]|eukprot:GAQ81793.1 hypothetical protein KFL_000910130 [Klebsormidium nitens]
MARSLRLQGTWTLVVLLLALIALSNLPSSHAQTSNSTATNTTSAVASPAKAPGPSPKKAPAPAPKKAPPPPPPHYPPDQRRTNAVYGLTFGGIGFCASVLAAVLVYDFVKKVGYFKPRETATTKQLLHHGEFTTEDAVKAIDSPPRRYS